MANNEFMDFVNGKHYLSDILLAQNKADLQILAENLNIENYKKLKVDDLRMALYENLRDPQVMANYLKYFPFEIRNVLSKEESNVPFVLGANPYDEILEHLYLSPITDDENWFLLIPEEIKETYKEAVSSGLLASENDIYSLLRICLAGATHLYGICTMDHFCKLVKELTDLDVDSDYVIDFCEELKAFPNLSDFIVTDEYVCDITLFEEGYDDFLEAQNQTETYYIPTLEELTFITNLNYEPFNIHANALKDFLLNRGFVDEEYKAIAATALLQNLINTGSDPDEALVDVLSELVPEDFLDRLLQNDGFLKRYESFVNNMRISFLKGHTINEVNNRVDNDNQGKVVPFPSNEK